MDEFARDTSLAGTTSSPEVASSARFIFRAFCLYPCTAVVWKSLSGE